MRMAKQYAEVFKCEAQITKDVYFLRSVDTSSFRLLKRIKCENGKAMHAGNVAVASSLERFPAFNVHDNTQNGLCTSCRPRLSPSISTVTCEQLLPML